VSALDRMRLLRGAEHLHRLGAGSIADLLAQLTARVGGGAALFGLLAEYERRMPAPSALRGAGRAPSRPRRIAGGRA